MTLFCLPETLYVPKAAPGHHQEQSFINNLTFRYSNVPARRPRLRDFIRPFQMLKCLAVLFPTALYMACFGYGTVLFALTGAEFFTKLYGFSTPQTGLMLSIPLIIGGVLGELGAGWVTDWLSNRHAMKHNGVRLPEARLTAIWGAILVPTGIIVEGVCLTHYETVSWVGSAFGMGLSNMGLQIATTTIYSYTTDVGCALTLLLGHILTSLSVLQSTKCGSVDSSECIPSGLFMPGIILCVSIFPIAADNHIA